MASTDRSGALFRGPVHKCTETIVHYGGKASDEGREPTLVVASIQEFDQSGNLRRKEVTNPDGSKWVRTVEYGPADRVQLEQDHIDGPLVADTDYLYDDDGRLQMITDRKKPGAEVRLLYDGLRLRAKIRPSRAEDYTSEISSGPDLFDIADSHPANLKGGGSSTTFFDDDSRPYKVEVRDSADTLVRRVLRVYDGKGRIQEEYEDDTDSESEIRASFGPFRLSYEYDGDSRLVRVEYEANVIRRITEMTYNEQNDVATEVIRITAPTGLLTGVPSRRELMHEYVYDEQNNWTKKATYSRSGKEEELRLLEEVIRTFAYY